MRVIPTEPDTTPTYIINPTKKDFSYPYDNIPYTLPSRKIMKFPKYLADHLAKHLANQLALEESNRIHYEDRVENWKKKIYVKI